MALITSHIPHDYMSGKAQAYPFERFVYLYTMFMMLMCAIVIKEPAPCDALMLGFIIMVPFAGYGRFHPILLFFGLLWCIILAGGFAASGLSFLMPMAIKHNLVTMFLAIFSLILAAFITKNPAKHFTVIFNGYVAGAVIAAIAGIIGYFDLLPGAKALFTKYERASGTFKDPNVLGPYLSLAALYMFDRLLNRPVLKSFWVLVGTIILLFALLITFSRGAWAVFFITSFVYAMTVMINSPTNKSRVKLVTLIVGGMIIGSLVLLIALQQDAVAKLWQERTASLLHSYDVGEGGRFSGQLKAMKLIMENPLGIGALIFGFDHHHELPHNNYISMFLNTGWLGGFSYLILTVGTLIAALPFVFQKHPWSQQFVLAYGAYVGIFLESFVIDNEHWRLLYILMGLVWGGIGAALIARRKDVLEKMDYATKAMQKLPKQPDSSPPNWQQSLWR